MTDIGCVLSCPSNMTLSAGVATMRPLGHSHKRDIVRGELALGFGACATRTLGRDGAGTHAVSHVRYLAHVFDLNVRLMLVHALKQSLSRCILV